MKVFTLAVFFFLNYVLNLIFTFKRNKINYIFNQKFVTYDYLSF